MNLQKAGFKVLSLLIVSLLLASCGVRKPVQPRQAKGATLQDELLGYSKSFLGSPYRYAGKGPTAFDCSGFTSFVFKKFGYNLNPSSAGQEKQVTPVTDKELKKGDLAFFGERRDNGRVGHVGIITEVHSNGEFKFIHSSTSHGVIISSSREPYYASRYLHSGRVIKEDSPIEARRVHSDIATSQTAKERGRLTAPVTSAEKKLKESLPNLIEIGEKREGAAKETVVLIQRDPSKNPPLQNNQPASHQELPRDKIFHGGSTEIAIKKDIHTVIPGDTLISIAKKYG